MIRLNLLDWRQARREQRQKNFGIAAGVSVVAGAAIVFAIITVINGNIDFQNQRNKRLEQEIAKLDDAIKEIQRLEKVKQDLLARMRVIEELQQSRSVIVHFFDELVTTRPDGLYLHKIVQRGKDTTIDGTAESNGRVSTYIRNLDASAWLQSPQLVIIKSDEQANRRYSEFQLKVKLQPDKDSGNDSEEVVE